MSRVLPILFNTDMVRAILDGRKTVTRRVIKPQPAPDLKYKLGICFDGDRKDIGKFAFGLSSCGEIMHFVSPPCFPGDILYVRETWAEIKNTDSSRIKYVYRATDTYPFGVKGYIVKFKWRPSIHMPKEAARIWLKVTHVRLERLQDVTVPDMIKEGIRVGCESCLEVNGKCNPQIAGDEFCGFDGEKLDLFTELWDSTIKKKDCDRYGWEANPWVWVIEFERCEKPEEE